MKQCTSCYRFLPDQYQCCRYCGSDRLTVFESLLASKFLQENKNYRIRVSRIKINGSDYEVAAPLDRGGFSVILKVKNLDLNTTYALKVPLIFDEEFTNRQGNSNEMLRKSEKSIYDEINALNKLDSSHALQIHFMGIVTVINQRKQILLPAILMEIAQTTLGQIIHNQANGKNYVAIEEKIKMVTDILNSVRCLHERRLIHRDISPDNVFVVKRKGELRYILSDYGTCRCHDDLTSSMLSSHIMAHQPYLDPERLTRADFDYDPRSDVYSTGIIIAEIFMDNFWISCVSPEQVNAHPLNFEKDILEPHLFHYFDRRLYRIIKKAAAYKASRRYKNIKELQKKMLRYFHRLDVCAIHSRNILSVLNLHVRYPIHLPLDLEVLAFDGYSDFAEIEVEYTGNNNIRFDTLGNFTIRFPDKVLDRVRLRGTSLFQLSSDNHTIHLRVDAGRFQQKYRRFRRILQQAEGKLEMDFHLDVSYIRL